jgi:2-hydroxycyclohexanecarboxyl-CoA dehydrogenase
MDDSFSLTGRRILITGAASGMARSFAGLAAADGAHVGLLDRNAAGLEETVAALGGDGRRIGVPVDLGDWPATEAAVGRVREVLGGFDSICNVAGWDAPGRFWEQPYEMWEQLIRVNLWSTLNVCRATVPDLVAQESGTIVNVASDAGRVGSKGETVYAAAKGGVMAFTKSAARELAPFKVTVNCICPGPTWTPLLEQEQADNPKLIEKLVRAIPLRRAADPIDQARVIAFFASEAAGYCTGQVLSVSGGLTMVG